MDKDYVERGRQRSTSCTLLTPPLSAGKTKNYRTASEVDSADFSFCEYDEFEAEHRAERVSELRSRKDKQHKSPVRKLFGLFKRKKSFEDRREKYDEDRSYFDEEAKHAETSQTGSKGNAIEKEKTKSDIPAKENLWNNKECDSFSEISELSFSDWLDLHQKDTREDRPPAENESISSANFSLESLQSRQVSPCQNEARQNADTRSRNTSPSCPFRSNLTESKPSQSKPSQSPKVGSIQNILVEFLESLSVDSRKNHSTEPPLTPDQTRNAEPIQSPQSSSTQSQRTTPHCEYQESSHAEPVRNAQKSSVRSNQVEALQNFHTSSMQSSSTELPQNSSPSSLQNHGTENNLRNHLPPRESIHMGSLLNPGMVNFQYSPVSHLEYPPAELSQSPCTTRRQCLYPSPHQRSSVETCKSSCLESLAPSHTGCHQSLYPNVPRSKYPYMEPLQNSQTPHSQSPLTTPLQQPQIAVMHSTFSELGQSDYTASCESSQIDNSHYMEPNESLLQRSLVENSQIIQIEPIPISQTVPHHSLKLLPRPTAQRPKMTPDPPPQMSSYNNLRTISRPVAELKANDGSFSNVMEPSENRCRDWQGGIESHLHESATQSWIREKRSHSQERPDLRSEMSPVQNHHTTSQPMAEMMSYDENSSTMMESSKNVHRNLQSGMGRGMHGLSRNSPIQEKQSDSTEAPDPRFEMSPVQNHHTISQSMPEMMSYDGTSSNAMEPSENVHRNWQSRMRSEAHKFTRNGLIRDKRSDLQETPDPRSEMPPVHNTISRPRGELMPNGGTSFIPMESSNRRYGNWQNGTESEAQTPARNSATREKRFDTQEALDPHSEMLSAQHRPATLQPRTEIISNVGAFSNRTESSRESQQQTDIAISKRNQPFSHQTEDRENNHTLKVQVVNNGNDLSSARQNRMGQQVSGLAPSFVGKKNIFEMKKSEVDKNDFLEQPPKPLRQSERQKQKCVKSDAFIDEADVSQRQATLSNSSSSADTFYTVEDEIGDSHATTLSRTKPKLVHVMVNQVQGESQKLKTAFRQTTNVPFIHLSPTKRENAMLYIDSKKTAVTEAPFTFRFGNNINGKRNGSERLTESPTREDQEDISDATSCTAASINSDSESELSETLLSSYALTRSDSYIQTNLSDCYSSLSEESIPTIPRGPAPLPSSLPPMDARSDETLHLGRHRAVPALSDRNDHLRERYRRKRDLSALSSDKVYSNNHVVNTVLPFKFQDRLYKDDAGFIISKELDECVSRHSRRLLHSASPFRVRFELKEPRHGRSKWQSSRRSRHRYSSPEGSRILPICDQEWPEMSQDLKREGRSPSRTSLVVNLCDVDQNNRYFISSNSVEDQAHDDGLDFGHDRDDAYRSQRRGKTPPKRYNPHGRGAVTWSSRVNNRRNKKTVNTTTFKGDTWPLFSLGRGCVLNEIRSEKKKSSVHARPAWPSRNSRSRDRHSPLSPDAERLKAKQEKSRVQFKESTREKPDYYRSKREHDTGRDSFSEAPKSRAETEDRNQSCSHESPGYFQFKGINFSETSVRIASAPKLNQQNRNSDQHQQPWVPMFGAAQQQFPTPFVPPQAMNISGYFPSVPLIPNMYGDQGIGLFPQTQTHVPLRFFSPFQQQWQFVNAGTNGSQSAPGGSTPANGRDCKTTKNLNKDEDATAARSKTQDNAASAAHSQKKMEEESSKPKESLIFTSSKTKLSSNVTSPPKPRKWRQCERERDDVDAWWMPKDWAKRRGIGSYRNGWQFEKDKVEKQEKELQIAKDANIEQIRMSRFVAM